MEKTKEFEMRTKLAGKNNIRLFRQVARRLASDIARCKQVTGMVFLGGLARGFTDKSSDLDGMIFLERKNQVQETQIRDMVTKEAKRSGIDIDLEIHLLKDFAKWKWTEINRWDFSHAEIAFDKKEHIRRIIEAKLKIPDEFWTRRIVLCAEYMKWYCYPPKKSIGTIAEAWID
jgi:predicted nucleotidyltransferase